MAERLRDIIDIPEIKPVIELDDADTIPDSIVSSFVLTREVEEGLRVILARIIPRVDYISSQHLHALFQDFIRQGKIIIEEAEKKVLHFNFIDTKVHNSTLDIYPLYLSIKSEFINGIAPILKRLPSFTFVSDHGFVDTGRMKERYIHGGSSIWETVLPCVEVE